MRIYVTGYDGILGSDLCPELERAGHALSGLDFVEITDPAVIRADIAAAHPDWVLHLAAYTDVDGAETHEELARHINEDGSRHVAEGARAAGARLLVVSTDYVYDGRQPTPYVETDPVGPLSAYGRTKLAGERAALAVCPGALIVRTAWLYGPAGKNFVDTMLRLAGERPAIDVVADQVGCPTYSAELARGLRALVEAGAGGVVHATGGGSTSWYGFAREILRQAGEDPEKIRRATTEQLGRPAPRPAHSVLANERFAELVGWRLAEWPEALGDYLARRRVGVRR